MNLIMKKFIPRIGAIITGGLAFKILKNKGAGDAGIIMGTAAAAGLMDTVLSVGMEVLDNHTNNELGFFDDEFDDPVDYDLECIHQFIREDLQDGTFRYTFGNISILTKDEFRSGDEFIMTPMSGVRTIDGDWDALDEGDLQLYCSELQRIIRGMPIEQLGYRTYVQSPTEPIEEDIASEEEGEKSDHSDNRSNDPDEEEQAEEGPTEEESVSEEEEEVDGVEDSGVLDEDASEKEAPVEDSEDDEEKNFVEAFIEAAEQGDEKVTEFLESIEEETGSKIPGSVLSFAIEHGPNPPADKEKARRNLRRENKKKKGNGEGQSRNDRRFK